MRLSEETIHLTPTDLSHHLACRHLTFLNLSCAKGELDRPHFDDPGVEVLQQKGLEHEAAYLDHLRSQGLEVVRLDQEALQENI